MAISRDTLMWKVEISEGSYPWLGEGELISPMNELPCWLSNLEQSSLKSYVQKLQQQQRQIQQVVFMHISAYSHTHMKQ